MTSMTSFLHVLSVQDHVMVRTGALGVEIIVKNGSSKVSMILSPFQADSLARDLSKASRKVGTREGAA